MTLFFLILIVIAIIIFVILVTRRGSKKERDFQDAINTYKDLMINEALKKFQDLLYEEPYNSLFHWYIARCYMHKKDYTSSIYHLENILQINNYSLPAEDLPDIEDFSQLGIHHRLMGIFETLKLKDKLIEQYEKLMEMDPANEEYPLKIAEYYIGEKNYSEKTQGYLERILGMNPKNGKAQFLLTLIYFKNAKFDEALQSAEKTIAIDRSINDAFFIIGYLRYRVNLKEEAEKNFRDAALCKFFRKSNSFYLAKLLQNQGKIDFALSYAADANKVSVSPHEDPALELESRYLYATLLEESDRFKEAMEMYKAIQNIQPDYQDVARRLKYMTPIETSDSTSPKPGKGDSIEFFKTVKLHDFAQYSEKLMEKLGYKVKKVDLINDQTINMLAIEAVGDANDLIGVFIRRGIGIIQEEQIKKIEHFMTGMQVKSAFLITPNDFNPAARKIAEKKGIKTINGESLREMLNNVI